MWAMPCLLATILFSQPPSKNPKMPRYETLVSNPLITLSSRASKERKIHFSLEFYQLRKMSAIGRAASLFGRTATRARAYTPALRGEVENAPGNVSWSLQHLQAAIALVFLAYLVGPKKASFSRVLLTRFIFAFIGDNNFVFTRTQSHNNGDLVFLYSTTYNSNLVKLQRKLYIFLQVY